jgi:hypothetical protein
MLKTYPRIELHPRQQDLLWFHQYGTAAHRAEISMQVLRIIFPGRLISRFGNITWPVRSPDYAALDYFLWGYFTSKVYEKFPANIADFKQRILECIQEIFKEMLRRIMTVFPSRLQGCKSTTWWSPTKCYIQTIMNKTSSHGHGMHPIVLMNILL